MNGLDIAIAVSLLAAFVGGYRTGLVARAASWAGLTLGLLVMGRNIRPVLELFGNAKNEKRPLYIAGLLVVGAFIGKLAGLVFGKWVRRRLPTRPLRSVDRIGGGVLGLAGVVLTVWLLVPLLAQVPGVSAEVARSSVLARVVHDRLPTAPHALASIRRVIDGGRFPQVVSALRRSIDSGAPPANVALALATQTQVQYSTVQVSAIACGVLSDGSGFSVGGGRVVTNAHVVSGAKAISVVDFQGDSHPGTLEFLDAARDLAMVKVDGYAAPELELADPDVGDELAVFGHPNGGGLAVQAVGLRDKVQAVGRDIYDDAKITRSVLVLAGTLRPGDSGAAVVNRTGLLVGVAFATAPDRPTTAYALHAQELANFLASHPVGSPSSGDAGQCLLK